VSDWRATRLRQKHSAGLTWKCSGSVRMLVLLRARLRRRISEAWPLPPTSLPSAMVFMPCSSIRNLGCCCGLTVLRNRIYWVRCD
jgi:hypothetical protein